MTAAIIITFCVLLLVAYVFDLTSTKTRIPSVVMLLALGWGVKQVTNFLGIALPDFTPVLPVLGTIGLILIVLDGTLELELDKSKFVMIRKAFLGALLTIFALATAITLAFHFIGHFGWKDSAINAIPLCVISSAIAIPSVRHLTAHKREYVTYESSFSDIFGVIIFNFLLYNENIDAPAFLGFGAEMLIIVVVTFLATMGLSFLLNRIEHNVKFVPIVLLIVLIYELAKVYDLPALVFILLFGIFIGNIDVLKQFSWIERFKPDELKEEVVKFKELITEGTFLIRVLFFLLFGYLIQTRDVLNTDSLMWAVGIVSLILLTRLFQLWISRISFRPLVFIAPRGLITILLFLSIDEGHNISVVTSSLIIQVVILSALAMMLGLMTVRKQDRG